MTAICKTDPFCCYVKWDAYCAKAAQDLDTAGTTCVCGG